MLDDVMAMALPFNVVKALRAGVSFASVLGAPTAGALAEPTALT